MGVKRKLKEIVLYGPIYASLRSDGDFEYDQLIYKSIPELTVAIFLNQNTTMLPVYNGIKVLTKLGGKTIEVLQLECMKDMIWTLFAERTSSIESDKNVEIEDDTKKKRKKEKARTGLTEADNLLNISVSVLQNL